MAVKSRAVTVATTATRLDTVDDTTDSVRGQSFAFVNEGAVTVYWGGSDVTTSDGVPVEAGGLSHGLELATGDAVYGIVATGTCEVRVGETGV